MSHATHSVKHAVGNVLDHDAAKRAHRPVPVPPKSTVRPPARSGASGSQTLGTLTLTSQQTTTAAP
ncbi:MAG: hypothetical protein JWN81_1444 [Solirubrobacterales bacterium]|nr:hypothetical protein [Solirubrobacterales bacterium]